MLLVADHSKEKVKNCFSMIPFADVMPVIIIPVKITRQDILSLEFIDDSPGDLFSRQKPTQKCAGKYLAFEDVDSIVQFRSIPDP
jgi:hypothetical protein